MDDDNYLTATCRQCGETVRVADEPQPDGPYVCDACIRQTVNRAARGSRLSDHIYETAVEMARARR